MRDKLLMSLDNILFAGPFVGEFGMELFTWQPHIRKMAENFDKTIISSRPVYKYLYEDFCDQFVSYDPQSYDADGYECINESDIPMLHEQFNPSKLIRVLNLKDYSREINGTEKKFFSYGSKIDNAPDICLCIRNFKNGANTKLQRNWELSSASIIANELINFGIKTACVGMSVNAAYVEGTQNYLDYDLRIIANVLRSSKLIVGPSGGLIHFATLCMCPQLVWGESHLEKRYRQEWNPFDVSVDYITKSDYQIENDILLNKIFDYLENKK
ncbi:MAG: hypothetical protein Q7R95_09120 [bacterium]|nr:hypothetical protein [bacterium]